jgi:hypothetical protein
MIFKFKYIKNFFLKILKQFISRIITQILVKLLGKNNKNIKIIIFNVCLRFISKKFEFFFCLL